MIVPISVIIATSERLRFLQTTIKSIAGQSHQPAQIIIVDSSQISNAESFKTELFHGLESVIVYDHVKKSGSACQRNQGLAKVKSEFIGFMDDDIVLEENCVFKLWECLQHSDDVGGVNAMITNQRYHLPSLLTRMFYRIIDKKHHNYGGKLIGPLINILYLMNILRVIQ